MPNLKDRSSDERLNPSQQDYAKKFEEITGSPDMQALNDQGDALIRNLGDSERNIESPGGSTKNTDTDAIQKAEKDPEDAPEDRQKNKRSVGKSGWSRRQKIVAGAGAGGGIIAILASFLALLPLKLPGVLQMITDEAAQRVEQVTEKRAKLIIGRAILTRFGTHTGIVLTGDRSEEHTSELQSH